MWSPRCKGCWEDPVAMPCCQDTGKNHTGCVCCFPPPVPTSPATTTSPPPCWHLLAQMLSAPDFLFLCIFEIPDERKTVAREWVSFREPQTAVQLSGFARLSTVKGLVGTETSQRKSLDYKTTGAPYGEHILQLGSHSGDESHRDPLPADRC